MPNPSRGTKFSGANGDREEIIFVVHLADHEQDWPPYPVDPYHFTICDDNTLYIHHTYPCSHTYMYVCMYVCIVTHIAEYGSAG